MKHKIDIKKFEANLAARKQEIAKRVSEMNARHETEYAALKQRPDFSEIQAKAEKAFRYILSPKFTKISRMMQGC